MTFLLNFQFVCIGKKALFVEETSVSFVTTPRSDARLKLALTGSLTTGGGGRRGGVVCVCKLVTNRSNQVSGSYRDTPRFRCNSLLFSRWTNQSLGLQLCASKNAKNASKVGSDLVAIKSENSAQVPTGKDGGQRPFLPTTEHKSHLMTHLTTG